MPRTRWLTPEEDRAWRRYRRMRTLLDLQLARDLNRDSRLSEADYDVLSTLSESPDGQWRAGDLATRLLWSTSRLAHQVRRMEERGLVDRRASADDGRGAVVALSPDGWSTLRAAAAPHVDSVRQHFIGLLTATELRTLDRIAGKIVRHLGGSVG